MHLFITSSLGHYQTFIYTMRRAASAIKCTPALIHPMYGIATVCGLAKFPTAPTEAVRRVGKQDMADTITG